MAEIKPFLTSGAVCAALRVLFPKPVFAVFFEIANATGGAAARRIDCLVQGLWPSRGLDLTAIEIKVSRTDWQKELANPAKAESIAKFCDRFYLAVGDLNIIKDDELPEGWGLIGPNAKGKLTIIKPAPKHKPQPMSRQFLASVFRAADENSSKPIDELIHQARNESYDRGMRDGKEHERHTCARVKTEADSYRQVIERFHKETGIWIMEDNFRSSWGSKTWWEAVQFVRNGGLKLLPESVQKAQRLAAEIADACEKYAKAIANAQEGEPNDVSGGAATNGLGTEILPRGSDRFR